MNATANEQKLFAGLFQHPTRHTTECCTFISVYYYLSLLLCMLCIMYFNFLVNYANHMNTNVTNIPVMNRDNWRNLLASATAMC